MTIGAGDSSTFRVDMKMRTGGTFAIRGEVCRFFPHGLVKDFSINGAHPMRDVCIRPSSLYLVTLAGACFFCWFGTEEGMPAFREYDISKWYVYNLADKSWSHAFSLPELYRAEPELPPDSLVACEGMRHCAFQAKDMMEVSLFAGTLSRFLAPDAAVGEEDRSEVDRVLRCPFCWESFSGSDILSVASHPDLKGDSILGEEAMRRFKPTHYDRQGLPLDECGVLCRGTACPHCHSKLPPFFSELHPRVISLVGVRGAGKTYYLTTLFNEAARGFSRDFDASFRDIAPALNASLNRRRQQLFAATTPQQAYLEPTTVAPPYYNRIWKNGHFEDLPVPFLHGISRQGASCSVLTYDNSWQGREQDASESAELAAGHIDIASAVFFLFDPTQATSFNRLLKRESGGGDAARQNFLLNDLEMKLRMRFNLAPPAKLPIPLAFIMCKKDVWQELLGPEPLFPAIYHGRLMNSCIQANSKRLRQLLFSISPQLCLSAESLSDTVCYFAVSSFGKEPVAFSDAQTGELRYAPESGAIQPEHVWDPLLWALSLLEPNLLPKNN